MRVSAKVDYAVRAALELAAHEGDRLLTADRIADRQAIPRKFLENILQMLRQGGLVESRRGPEGGHRLARPASEVTIADVVRAVDGPLGRVGGRVPEDVTFLGVSAPMREVWVATRAGLRAVLEHVTLADVAGGRLPEVVRELTASEDAWHRR